MTKDQMLEWIEDATYIQLLRKWRFAPSGDPFSRPKWRFAPSPQVRQSDTNKEGMMSERQWFLQWDDSPGAKGLNWQTIEAFPGTDEGLDSATAKARKLLMDGSAERFTRLFVTLRDDAHGPILKGFNIFKDREVGIGMTEIETLRQYPVCVGIYNKGSVFIEYRSDATFPDKESKSEMIDGVFKVLFNLTGNKEIIVESETSGTHTINFDSVRKYKFIPAKT